MKIIGSVLIVLAIILGAIFITQGVFAGYNWENTIASNWLLSEKASTISQKSEYMDKFVASLESSGLQGQNDALFLNTPNNSFDMNLVAVKSLQKRLSDIKTMDENSFQYQSAIEQITKQEQGEAKSMISVLEGCWWKVHQTNLWNIWGIVNTLLVIVLFMVGGAFLTDSF